MARTAVLRAFDHVDAHLLLDLFGHFLLGQSFRGRNLLLAEGLLRGCFLCFALALVEPGTESRF